MQSSTRRLVGVFSFIVQIIVLSAFGGYDAWAAPTDRASCLREGAPFKGKDKGKGECCSGLSPVAGYCVKNTNACFAVDAPAVGAACAQGPSAACCEALASFQSHDCGCSAVVAALTNNAFQNLVDPNGVPNPGIAAACSAYYQVNIGTCEFKHTYNNGQCQASDDQIDLARLIKVRTLDGVFAQFSNIPFIPPDPSYAQGQAIFEPFKAALGAVFEPDDQQPFTLVPWGVGKYVGVERMVEYISLATPVMSRGQFRIDQVPNPSDVVFWEMDGSFHVGNHSLWEVYPRLDTSENPPSYKGQSCTKVAQGYAEQAFTFTGCDDRIHSLRVVGGQSEIPWQTKDPAKFVALPEAVRNFVNSARSNQWGIPAICDIHQKFCAGTSYQQFDSYAACVKYMESQPVLPKTGGRPGVMGGESLPCRFKHSMMIPMAPEAHCAHIGPQADRGACVDDELKAPGVLGPRNAKLNLDITDYPEELQCMNEAGGLYPTFVGKGSQGKGKNR